MNSNRDYSIDNLRGLATISVLFIHTVWWSGESYVPIIVKNLSLLFDVPIFFILTGCLLGLDKKINFFSSMYKIVSYFAVYVIIYQIIFLDINLNHIFAAILMNGINTQKTIVVSGSYWFVPTYVACLFLSTVIITKHRNKVFFMILLLSLLLPLSFFDLINVKASFLGVPFDRLVFYTLCMLLGYSFARSSRKEIYYYFLLSFFVIWLICALKDNKYLILQDYKFGSILPYAMASCLSIFLTLFLIGKAKTETKFVTFIGKNSIHFYLSQGISSTLIYMIVRKIDLHWPLKLMIIFAINFVLFYIIGKAIFFISDKFKFYLNKIHSSSSLIRPDNLH